MRLITPTLTAAAAALALAACGGGASDPSTASGEDKAFEGALKFARCMRAEGLDFPDPERGSNGMVRIGPSAGQGPNPDDPRTRSALKTCERHLVEGGGQAPDAAQQAKFQDAFLDYARCMRGEGVNIPDRRRVRAEGASSSAWAIRTRPIPTRPATGPPTASATPRSPRLTRRSRRPARERRHRPAGVPAGRGNPVGPPAGRRARSLRRVRRRRRGGRDLVPGRRRR
jgi:hypothetical protein